MLGDFVANRLALLGISLLAAAGIYLPTVVTRNFSPRLLGTSVPATYSQELGHCIPRTWTSRLLGAFFYQELDLKITRSVWLPGAL